jgi:3-phytase
MIDSKTPDKLITSLNADVEADIEGVSLYTLDGLNYLVVSSQGNNKYAVYAVDDNNKYLGVFEIAANWSKMIDGTSETDGLAVTSQSLGAELPNGLMVIQDGHNVLPKANQNFKLVKGSLLKDWLLARVIQ